MKAAVAEMMASAIFVFIGCGAACANGASDGETNLVVAFTFGISWERLRGSAVSARSRVLFGFSFRNCLSGPDQARPSNK